MRDPKQLRSPLTEPPLRQAGQSLDKRLNDLLDDTALTWILAVGLSVLLAALEWIRHLTESKPSPLFFTLVAVVVFVIAAFRLRTVFHEVRLIKLGRDGERVVADHLQELVGAGWRIFHDIQGDGFNIDHIAIGPGGIFTVETKTRSKPIGRNARIVVDQQGISVAGGRPSRETIDQALAQASWLKNQLRSSTGETFEVRAAVVFPNWYVVQRGRPMNGNPWVLEPKALVAWLKKQYTRLTSEQVAMASHHLERMIKAAERK